MTPDEHRWTAELQRDRACAWFNAGEPGKALGSFDLADVHDRIAERS